MKKLLTILACGLLALHSAAVLAAPPIHVLILDGESGGTYHNWRVVTPILKAELDETGLFVTEVLTAPPSGGDFSQFHPEWSKYQVVVFNYDAPDDRWSSEVKTSFEDYMKKGGGLVTVHAADNAFPKWEAFNEMIGIGGWRGRTEAAGPLWHYKDGKLVSDDSPGRAGNHGLRLPYLVTVRDPTHPILKGLPKQWMHQGDELYSKLRGPGKMTVLATAYSDTGNMGTGFDEPQLMVNQFGKGRIFHTTLGHDGMALASVDAVVTFQRGVEWAATGKVTQPVPASFPTANTVSYRADLAIKDPNYVKGLNPLDAQQSQRPGMPGTGMPPGGVTPAPGGRPAPTGLHNNKIGVKPLMTTIKGPGIFLAQFAGDQAPYNSLDSIAGWAAGLGFKGIQIPSWDARLFDLKLAAESQTYCDEMLGTIASHGLVLTELSTHLQGQLVAVHPAYDLLFDGFAPAHVHGSPASRTAWAVEQLGFAAKASRNLGLDRHATFSGALAWPYLYPWPQRPAGLVETAFGELATRWLPILNAFDECGVDLCYEIHPGEDLHDGASFEMFLDLVKNHPRCNLLYDPSHFVLQQLKYLEYIDLYRERIKMFHVKDAEFNPTGRQGVYGGFQSWANRAGRFRSLGDGQVDFGAIFSKLTQYGFDGWAVMEWECCIKSSEQGAREGAPFIAKHIIATAERAFDDFAGASTDKRLLNSLLGLKEGGK